MKMVNVQITAAPKLDEKQSAILKEWKECFNKLKDVELDKESKKILLDIFVGYMGIDKAHSIFMEFLRKHPKSKEHPVAQRILGSGSLVIIEADGVAVPVGMFQTITITAEKAAEAGMFITAPKLLVGALALGAVCGLVVGTMHLVNKYVEKRDRKEYEEKAKKRTEERATAAKKQTSAEEEETSSAKKPVKHDWKTGPRGGKYYEDDKGNKIYDS